MARRVAVTGANGHVGNALARLLAERGYEVRAVVRRPEEAGLTEAMRGLRAEVVGADLLDHPALQRAFAGCEGLFQVAAVYKIWARDPEKEILEPSLRGGVNALQAALAAGIRKVVFTSSVAAVGSDASPDQPLTEDRWNDGAVCPYFIAKTRAEKSAWEFARAHALNLTVLNPVAIIGPGFHRHTPSTWLFERILRGRLPFALPTGLAYVDVRDVAEAHALAYERAKGGERYLVAAEYFEMPDLMAFLRRLEPGLPAPRLVLPRALLGILPALDWLEHILAGSPRQLTRALLRELGGRRQCVSTEKIRRELGWSPRPIEETLRDTLAWIRSRFLQGDRRREGGRGGGQGASGAVNG